MVRGRSSRAGFSDRRSKAEGSGTTQRLRCQADVIAEAGFLFPWIGFVPLRVTLSPNNCRPSPGALCSVLCLHRGRYLRILPWSALVASQVSGRRTNKDEDQETIRHTLRHLKVRFLPRSPTPLFSTSV